MILRRGIGDTEHVGGATTSQSVLSLSCNPFIYFMQAIGYLSTLITEQFGNKCESNVHNPFRCVHPGDSLATLRGSTRRIVGYHTPSHRGTDKESARPTLPGGPG